MPTYLAVYTGTAAGRQRSGWDTMDGAQRAEREQRGMKAWGDWMAVHAQSVVVTGGPLGTAKLVSSQGLSDTSNYLAGYVIVQAESHAAAARMFENHPHFAIFPGDGVEVMECLPIPGT